MTKFVGWLASILLLFVACEGTNSPAAVGDTTAAPSIDATIDGPDGVDGFDSSDEGADGVLNDGSESSDATDPTDGTVAADGTDATDGTDPNAHTTVLICFSPPAKGWCHFDEAEALWLCCDANGEPDFSVSDAAKQVDCKVVTE